MHPDIKLVLEEREASAILPALNSQQFDLAFVRDNYLRGGLCIAEDREDRMLVVVSIKHRFAGAEHRSRY